MSLRYRAVWLSAVFCTSGLIYRTPPACITNTSSWCEYEGFLFKLTQNHVSNPGPPSKRRFRYSRQPLGLPNLIGQSNRELIEEHFENIQAGDVDAWSGELDDDSFYI
jgi:hypothetical protein